MDETDREGRRPQGDRRREDKRRTEFARAIARSEFGRHYWSDRQEAELRAARTKKPGKK